MAEQFDEEWARGVIEGGKEKAASFIDDPDKIDVLLGQLQEKLKGLPENAVKQFIKVPLMASMVKSYVTGEYKAISPKVVIAVISAIIYLVKPKDLIPDYVPVLGLVDDLAVIAIAVAICKPELEAYSEWKKTGVIPAKTVDVDPEPAQ